MSRKRTDILLQSKMKRAIAAFRKKDKTILSHLVVEQIFKDREITQVKGENSYEFAVRVTDNFLDLVDFNSEELTEMSIREAIKGYYNIINGLIP
jgi:hypothetical protein